jgi:1-acyl-sn-glycerol-3-phosphate acyltransferase
MFRIPLITVAFFVMTPALVAIQWTLERLGMRGWSTVTMAYYRLLRGLLRVRVRIVGTPVTDHPVLIVANHVSWADIVLLGSIAPVAFIAKREIADWPLIGQGAKAQRSVFVDRNRRHQTAEAIAEIAQRLTDGTPVVLFAEGTSSDGNRVLPFRSALVGAARDALAQAQPAQQVMVQPLSITYTRFQGLPMGRHHRPIVAWYGDLDFMPHIKEFIRRGAVDAVVTWGEPIAYDGSTNRKALVKSLEDTVRKLAADARRGGRLSAPVPAA